MIEAKNITKYYGDLQVLKGVDLDIKQGEIVAIVGPSGAGKTTLLQILGTLDKPSNKIESLLKINDQNVTWLDDSEISKFRNQHIGFIFQFHQLLPEFTALENVCIPAFIGNRSKSEVESEAKRLLSFLGLEERIHHKPSELSGGEQQRVAVARALINNPKVIFADEPSGNLDSASAKNLHELFFKLRDEFNQTFVIITHNTELANMADRKLEMKDGIMLNKSSTINIENSDFIKENKIAAKQQKKKRKIEGNKAFLGGISSLTSGIIATFIKEEWSLIMGIPLCILGVILIISGLYTARK